MERIHTDLNRTTLHKNLTDLSALLAIMSDGIAKGNMEPEHDAKCAEILIHIRHMMVEMTGSPGNATYEKHQNQIEKLEKEWDAWEEMKQH